MSRIESIQTRVIIINAYEEVIADFVSTEQAYNHRGDLVSEILYGEDGSVESKRVFEVDEDGRILVQLCHEQKNDLTERTEFFDQSEGIQYKTEITGSDGSKTIHEYHYDQLGNTDRITIKNEEGQVEAFEVFAFNDQGQVTEEIRLNPQFNPEYRKKLTYSPDGLLIIEEYFDRDRLVRTVDYTYNERRLVLEKKERYLETDTAVVNRYQYDMSGNQVLDETFQNERPIFRNYCSYDEHNNLVEERIISLGSENHIEVRHHTIWYRA